MKANAFSFLSFYVANKKLIIYQIAVALSFVFASISSPMSFGIGETYSLFGAPPTVEEYVTEYFNDIPIMSDIAFCESTFRQFNENGDTLRGKENYLDIGVMQINEYYHLEPSIRLSHDIYTLTGNLEYARHLYEKEGTAPWLSSSDCWSSENHMAIL